ncbi:PREDICTED: NADH dehydrogenase [ubiquinone] 1 alpha subcomplex subunit 12-like [Amphimedon queenslandica]|uniref:NADH dehydrogenase [ubiquinone] 1 alpha subcomplex subunit 12 n=1 Tax=Amphimedon queenslandica TaxID=400682 RepID=A0A1X7TZX4_AMPQE|nr:PREDICTED: NADH dehydrogenase [ubiquinone] 1 alpha subcomplex subunit 12-like [Amphimedon queenslandica]|eukprot:XP_003389329.1 PREDICTED: NADH dehydrogenase [ubiquinone] 1 alpha subcomplex subunit 12-like [Amphimedon queenslandica]
MATIMRVWKRINEVGGFRKAFWMLLRLRDIRIGTIVGQDKFGHVYYENKEHFFGRHRWVYKEASGFDITQIPPEWHRWLHSMTDHTPIEDPPPPRKFYLDPTVNKTGTRGEYVPYSTTRPKIQSWKPPQQ